MGEFDLNKTTVTDLSGTVDDFKVNTQTLDSPGEQQDETTYTFDKAAEQLGYYKSIPELKKAIDSLAIWSVAQGFKSDARTKSTLDSLTGWGEDSFTSIVRNLITQKKIFGDAFAEIIRGDNNSIINIKPLYTGDMKVVVDGKGIIKRYEQLSSNKKSKPKVFAPNEILHLANNRIGNEIHGVSVVDAVKWVIDSRAEAMNDWRRLSHRSTIRLMYIDADNTTKLNSIKTEYASAIDKGELMLIPAKKGEAEFQDLDLPPIQNHLQWIQYLENYFYQAVGVPRVIATSENFTEAASKIGFLTFEPIYTSEQVELESDLWLQAAIKVTFTRPPSLSGVAQDNEEKNTGQTGFQQNESQVGVGRTE